MMSKPAFLKYCEKKGINPEGQFAQEDGYLFHDGYQIGYDKANRACAKFMRMSAQASKMQSQRIKELEDDLCFKVSEAHVATMGRLMGLQEAVQAVLEEELSGVQVHPCDEHSEEAKARELSPIMRRLYEVFHGQR